MPRGAGQSPSSTFPSPSMRMMCSARISLHKRYHGLHRNVPSGCRYGMGRATLSSYPSRHKVRASNTTSSRGLRSGISFSWVGMNSISPPRALRQDVFGQRVAEETGRVLAAHGPQLVHREMAPYLSHQLLGVGPRAVTVGVVGLEHDVVDPDAVAGVDGRGVIDRAEPEVALEHIGGADVPAQAVPRPVNDVVEAVEEHGHPSDAALGHGDLQFGVAD